jgi:hypothetical protein
MNKSFLDTPAHPESPVNSDGVPPERVVPLVSERLMDEFRATKLPLYYLYDQGVEERKLLVSEAKPRGAVMGGVDWAPESFRSAIVLVARGGFTVF